MKKQEKIEHMCELMGRKPGLAELIAVARKARWVCAECGRSASDSGRLCRPERLEPTGRS
ncbi:MAG: hypothetical protein HZB91_03090 [Elusimicrobia bacterium]|nr:hypothetical protein [Elusimicrobiota bacterium]